MAERTALSLRLVRSENSRGLSTCGIPVKSQGGRRRSAIRRFAGTWRSHGPTSEQCPLPAPHHPADRSVARYRPRNSEALFVGGVAGDHLLAPSLSRRMPVDGGTGGSSAD